ncbi:hypothetical protein PYCCODRAFT_960098 [Trametes coccinea BRFM310]|uniref:Uncharacterized protein n=1 Tax=Trametes coccinea (strain BRFM310) TaxID=1353009 RepID=A0A1Y2IZR9_TRAC3|nr:hypothetical protein PYCCODRAFT_960098 [Trametes coccinea BRFM310]
MHSPESVRTLAIVTVTHHSNVAPDQRLTLRIRCFTVSSIHFELTKTLLLNAPVTSQWGGDDSLAEAISQPALDRSPCRDCCFVGNYASCFLHPEMTTSSVNAVAQNSCLFVSVVSAGDDDSRCIMTNGLPCSPSLSRSPDAGATSRWYVSAHTQCRVIILVGFICALTISSSRMHVRLRTCCIL